MSLALSTPPPRNFSSASSSDLGSKKGARASAGSMFGGAGGKGARASVSTLRGLENALRPNNQQMSAPPAQLAPPCGKQTMKGLNERLDKYMSRVRMLEKSNKDMEDQIKAILLERGMAQEQDWDAIEKPLAELRKQIREMTLENARLLLRVDNARLASDDFRVKADAEQATRLSVEKDIAGMRKIIDDSSLNRLQVEGQIESLKEETAFLKKTHVEEVAELNMQIKESKVMVQMDAGKENDLSDIIAKIRAQYEKVAEKNREETEAWYQGKFDHVKAEVIESHEALQKERSLLNELRRQKQSVEIELQASYSMVHTLEITMNETEKRNGLLMSQVNERILKLEGELSQVRSQMERKTVDYQTLLNVKIRLEEEIAKYRHLLEGLFSDESSKPEEDEK
ncbi:hypothetical protein GJAV_G00258130 [Gymnothorax javanicus]|nr:hypothetical protein GJAV_G00258130 [Gymnothorax javanicus]